MNENIPSGQRHRSPRPGQAPTRRHAVQIALTMAASVSLLIGATGAGASIMPVGSVRSAPAGTDVASPAGASSDAAVPDVRGDAEVHPVDLRAGSVTASQLADIGRVIERDGRAPVVVTLRSVAQPPGLLSAEAEAAQREQFAQLRAGVLGEAAITSEAVLRSYDTLPVVAVLVDGAVLERLARSSRVASVDLDRESAPVVGVSVPLVGGRDAQDVLGVTGAGRAVAIVDTGVDSGHPFLGGRVQQQSCFATTIVQGQAAGACPNGSTTQGGPGAAAPCALPACSHGTHVAGIAAGRESGGTDRRGVAPDSAIYAIRAAHDTTCSSAGTPMTVPCVRFFDSGLLAALDQVQGVEVLRRVSPALVNLPPVAAVNLSLGSDDVFATICDVQKPAFGLAVRNLRSLGIATVVSAGNGGQSTGISAPACLAAAVSVGNTDRFDQPAFDTNSGAGLTLWAPGVGIESSVPGGTMAISSGTSMSAPHVTGAFALLRQKNPTASVAELVAAMTSSGRPVTDQRNNLTRPRLRVADALGRLTPWRTPNREAFRLNGTAVAVLSEGGGLANGSATITLPAPAAGHSTAAAFLYWTAIDGPAATATLDGRTLTGRLVTATSYPPPQGGLARLYRADVTVALSQRVGGPHAVTVAGDGRGRVAGASLVVVTHDPTVRSLFGERKVAVVRDDLGVLADPVQTHLVTFDNLPTGRVGTGAVVHLGVAEGDAAADNPVRIGSDAERVGQPASAVNLFNASDGPRWDDVAVAAAPGSASPASPSLWAALGRPAGGDELVTAYAALEYGVADRDAPAAPQPRPLSPR